MQKQAPSTIDTQRPTKHSFTRVVDKLCGDKLCVTSGVWTSCGRAAGVIEEEAKVHNQKQEPHTTMWGKRNQSSLPLGGNSYNHPDPSHVWTQG